MMNSRPALVKLTVMKRRPLRLRVWLIIPGDMFFTSGIVSSTRTTSSAVSVRVVCVPPRRFVIQDSVAKLSDSCSTVLEWGRQSSIDIFSSSGTLSEFRPHVSSVTHKHVENKQSMSRWEPLIRTAVTFLCKRFSRNACKCVFICK